jgi:hypothetical protein
VYDIESKGHSPEIFHFFVFAIGFKISGLRPSCGPLLMFFIKKIRGLRPLIYPIGFSSINYRFLNFVKPIKRRSDEIRMKMIRKTSLV